MIACVIKHILHARASIRELILMLVEILHSREKDLYEFIPAQSVLHDSPQDASRVNLFHEVLLLPFIDEMPYRNPSAVPAFDEIQPASSSRSIRNSEPPPECLTKGRKISATRTRSEPAKMSPKNIPFIELETDLSSFVTGK